MEQSVELAMKPPTFVADFHAGFFGQHDADTEQFGGSEQSVVVLVIDDDMVGRGQKLLSNGRRRFVGQILAAFASQKKLKQIESQKDENDLVDNHREGS